MGTTSKHQDLLVWQKSLALASKVYCVTRQLPAHERHGLQSQMRRSAVSVASNIAAGADRAGRAECIRYLSLARSSLTELETQIYITSDLQLIDRNMHLENDVAEVDGLLASLILKLREQPSRN